MPPKQATLGYVKTQLTLGRFFVLPAGTKPPVSQQTKLKGAKKAVKVKEEEEDSVEENVAKDGAPAAVGVETDGDGDAVMTGTPEAEEEVQPEKKKKEKKELTKGKAGTVPKKRARKLVASDEEPEPGTTSEKKIDEPVTKRGKLALKGTPKKDIVLAEEPKKRAPKAKVQAEKESEANSEAREDDEPVTKQKRSPTTSKTQKEVTKTAKGTKGPGQKAKVAEWKRKGVETKARSEVEEGDEPIAKPSKEAKKKVRKAMVVEEAEGESEAKSEAEGEPVSKHEKSSTAGKAPQKETLKKAPAAKETKEPGPKAKAMKEAENEEASEAKSEAEEDDDEPVSKRGRLFATRKPSKKETPKKTSAAKETKKSSPKAKVGKEGESEGESRILSKPEGGEEPPVKQSKKSTTAKSPVSPKKEAKLAKIEESDEESKSAAEEDVAGSDDDMKPAIAEKARKAVAKTLSGKALSHPFPDWPVGSPTPYGALVKTLQLVEGTTKRLEKLSHASLFLRQVLRLTPGDLLMVVHLMINKLAADYEGVELGIGESLLMKAIGESCGRSMDKIREDQREIGDLGMVAMKSRNNQGTLFKPKPLTIQSVHQGLLEIATVKGEGGQGRKVAGIKKLLAAAKGDEAKYLVRGLEGKLRTGLAENTVIVALSQAQIVHEMEAKGEKVSVAILTEAELKLRSVFSELPSYEVIVPTMAEHGILRLKEFCKLQPGVPLKPMLAKPTKAISEVLDRFENKRFTCEYKYDGERAQIHFVSPDSSITYPATSISATTSPTKGITKIFSRNSEDLSKKYPDILGVLDKWVKPGVESFVLDCEAVAWDKEEKRVLPFQQLMTRKRKDVKSEDVKVKVCVFAFDMLFLNGKSLCQETLEERRRLMHESFNEIEGEFTFATYADANDLEQIQVFLDESVKASCEGLMVKMLDGEESGYEPSKRSRNWLKIKKDYLAGIGDSLDLVVLGAYHGRGKRTSVYGAFLLACYNPSTQTYETICNIGTGFSEAILKEFHALLSELEIDKPKPYYTHDNGNKQQPDVWFEPKVVWEVKTADLSLSPVYKAAAGMADDTGKGRGISLRFPRFIRVRDDKSSEDATSSRQVADMYRRQEVVTNGSKKSKGVDDDFEY